MQCMLKQVISRVYFIYLIPEYGQSNTPYKSMHIVIVTIICLPTKHLGVSLKRVRALLTSHAGVFSGARISSLLCGEGPGGTKYELP